MYKIKRLLLQFYFPSYPCVGTCIGLFLKNSTLKGKIFNFCSTKYFKQGTNSNVSILRSTFLLNKFKLFLVYLFELIDIEPTFVYQLPYSRRILFSIEWRRFWYKMVKFWKCSFNVWYRMDLLLTFSCLVHLET